MDYPERDILFGGKGNDTLIGGEGIDRLFGKDGADTFVLEPVTTNQNRVIVRDFVDGSDQLGLMGGLSFDDLVIVSNGASNATLIRDANLNKTLAVLSGIDVAVIGSDDFTEVP